jgi:hypothetical protein
LGVCGEGEGRFRGADGVGAGEDGSGGSEVHFPVFW